MTSSRPYLIRALYEWITDNQLTPYILVDAEVAGTEVPKQYIEDGKIILNIAPQAVNDLSITNRLVEFNASFAGNPAHVYAPIKAILAIYARENGRGMVFNLEEEDEFEEPIAPRPQLTKAKKPKLSIVKTAENGSKE